LKCGNCSTAKKPRHGRLKFSNSTSRYDDDHQDRPARDAGRLWLRTQRAETRRRVREGRPHHHS
jgi:hypothetical protein